VAIKPLPGNHLHMTCDGLTIDRQPCPMQGPTKHDVTEEELLVAAEAAGWNVDRQFGLHYCAFHTIHDCVVCGAPTRSSVTDVAKGETTYYCDEHFDRDVVD
jgi:hypothetical protein